MARLVLTVNSVEVDEPRHLLALASATNPLVWMRKGEGMVGVGEVARLEFLGANRMRDAALEWQKVADAAHVTDTVNVPGSGLIAFGTFTFSPDSNHASVLIIPRIVVGRRNGTTWVTHITSEGDAAPHPEPVAAQPLGADYRVALRPGSFSPQGFRTSVTDAIARIRGGELDKVVLARDLVGRVPARGDVRHALTALALGYPDCWTYAVDNLIGSSPETLIRVTEGSVDARVLAGTMPRGIDAASDHDRAVALATDPKEKDEHEFAVQSVVAALRPHSSALATSDVPFTLKLPHLWHLATDFEGPLSDGSTSFDLIAALHPTAAVAGTPRREALQLIDELEPFDRGRYAGPVGWVCANGDGEWAVALRCCEIGETELTAYAGAGIVANSSPEHEFFETRMKFRAIAEALR